MNKETVRVNVVGDVYYGVLVDVSVAELKALGFTRTVVKPWKPVYGDRYWCIDAQGGEVCDFVWHDGVCNNARWDLGNCYQTEVEAIKARDKQLATVRVLRRLRELEGDWVADWSDSKQCKYYACINHTGGYFIADAWFMQGSPPEWYSTREAWEQVFKELEQDVKLMIGVV